MRWAPERFHDVFKFCVTTYGRLGSVASFLFRGLDSSGLSSEEVSVMANLTGFCWALFESDRVLVDQIQRLNEEKEAKKPSESDRVLVDQIQRLNEEKEAMRQ
jgi:hypothetical protein